MRSYKSKEIYRMEKKSLPLVFLRASLHDNAQHSLRECWALLTDEVIVAIGARKSSKRAHLIFQELAHHTINVGLSCSQVVVDNDGVK